MKAWILVYMILWHGLTGFILDKMEIPLNEKKAWVFIIVNATPIWILIYLLTH